jgi:hypothetical protein
VKHFPGLGSLPVSTVVNGRAARWAVSAARAGADLLLFTSPVSAAQAIRVLVPLARHGELDAHVTRVPRLRWRFD